MWHPCSFYNDKMYVLFTSEVSRTFSQSYLSYDEGSFIIRTLYLRHLSPHTAEQKLLSVNSISSSVCARLITMFVVCGTVYGCVTLFMQC